MKIANTNWTKNEFKAYLLLFAANTDYIETEIEKDIILECVDIKQYHKIHLEFDQDNDYQSIQKIKDSIKKFEYTEIEIDGLLQEIKELFLSDGNFDILEKNMFKFLQRIIKT